MKKPVKPPILLILLHKRVLDTLRNHFFPSEFIACLTTSEYKLQKGRAFVRPLTSPELTPGGKWDAHVRLQRVTCLTRDSSVLLELVLKSFP